MDDDCEWRQWMMPVSCDSQMLLKETANFVKVLEFAFS
jgi:hypothetical protein